MLHTISQSENLINSPNLLTLLRQDDAVLLWQDGVIIGLKNSDTLKQLIDKEIPVFALINDINARGLAPIYNSYVQQITMTNCIALTEKYHPQFAW